MVVLLALMKAPLINFAWQIVLPFSSACPDSIYSVRTGRGTL
jgi:hypothetical protein